MKMNIYHTMKLEDKDLYINMSKIPIPLLFLGAMKYNKTEFHAYYINAYNPLPSKKEIRQGAAIGACCLAPLFNALTRNIRLNLSTFIILSIVMIIAFFYYAYNKQRKINDFLSKSADYDRTVKYKCTIKMESIKGKRAKLFFFNLFILILIVCFSLISYTAFTMHDYLHTLVFSSFSILFFFFLYIPALPNAEFAKYTYIKENNEA